jgi:outer membrane receptor protein involved in Fe transport
MTGYLLRGRGLIAAAGAGFFSLIAVGAAYAADAADATSTAPAPKSTTAPEGLDEIVVTAQRREERIDKVPQAVQAISGPELTREGVENIAQTIALIPSATTASTIGPGATVYQIRGVASGETDGDATVGYYLDNFAFSMPGRPYAPVADFYDMNRVEVLRGPSGTLYGLGSLGGTIKVLTNDPALDKYEGSVRVTGGQTANAYGDYSGDMMFNAPLVDDVLAVRGVLSYKHQSGYAYIIPSEEKNGNPVDSMTARIKVLAKPTDALTVEVSYWHQFTHTKYSDRITYPDNPTYGGPAVDQTFGVAPSNYDLGTLDLAYNFGFATLQSTSGYLDNTVISNNGGFIPGIGNFTSFWPLETKEFNEDLRLVSNGTGALRWIGGLFFENADTIGGQSVALPDYSLPGLGDDSGYATTNNNKTISESGAVYGEGTYTVFNGLLDLTAGGRYYRENRTFNQNSAFIVFYPDAPNAVTPTINSTKVIEHTFNPHFNVSVHPTDDGIVFVDVAKGFRSGAITSSAIIEGANAALGTHFTSASSPDTLWNYELGTKWSFFDSLVKVEAIGYIFDWKDAQIELSPTLQTVVVPAGNVRGRGADLSLDWRLWNTGFVTKLSGNINQTTLSSVPVEISTGLPQIADGHQLPGTAKSSFTFLENYTHALSFPGDWDFYADLRYSARARQQSVFTGGAYAPYVGLASTRFGISNKHYDFAVYGDNLTDSRGPLDTTGGQYQIPYPRVIGLSFEAKL